MPSRAATLWRGCTALLMRSQQLVYARQLPTKPRKGHGFSVITLSTWEVSEKTFWQRNITASHNTVSYCKYGGRKQNKNKKTPTKPHLRCQQNRHNRPRAEGNLKHVPVYCKRNIVHNGWVRFLVGPLLKDEVFEVKSLNGDGARPSVSPLCSADWTAMRAARRSATF